MAPMLAWIIPLETGGGRPEHPIYNPPYPSTGPGFPTAPIYLPPGVPPGGQPPYPSQGPGFPTAPIYIPPVGPGGQPVYPSQPIYWPPYPSQGPGFPTAPIAPGGPPPSVWPSPGYPSHPIAPGGEQPSFPINKPPDETPPEGFEWKMVYIPGIGWGWACVPTGGAEPEKK
jgi:hypothetical protein